MSTRKHDNALDVLQKLTGGLTLGKIIWAIRTDEGIPLSDLAQKFHISKSHLCDIEKGRKTVSPERALRFAKILGQPGDMFVSLALQGMLDKAKIKMKVKLEAA